MFDVGVGHLAGAAVVAFSAFHDGKFHVVDGGFEHPVVEFALLDEGDLFVEESLNLFEGLTLHGLATKHEGAIVVERVASGIGTHAALLLVDVDVDETALSVVENALEEVCEHSIVGAVAAVEAVGADGVFSIEAGNVLGDDGGDGFFTFEFEFGDVTGFHVAPIFVDDADGLVGVEVACHADADVVGDIIGGDEIADVAHGGVLEVLLATESGLVAIGVVGEEGSEHGVVHLAVVFGERHVFLLIDGLQFGVEEAQDKILETVGLNLAPGLQLVVGDVFDIHGVVVGGEGVGASGTDGSHGLVVLVGDGDFGGFVTQAVNLVVDGSAGLRVVEHAVGFEKVFNLLDKNLFLFPVSGAKTLGTLEHHVFEIVCQAGGFVRVIP